MRDSSIHFTRDISSVKAKFNTCVLSRVEYVDYIYISQVFSPLDAFNGLHFTVSYSYGFIYIRARAKATSLGINA